MKLVNGLGLLLVFEGCISRRCIRGSGSRANNGDDEPQLEPQDKDDVNNGWLTMQVDEIAIFRSHNPG